MASRNELFILECTPKCDHREGEVLFNFLDMTEPDTLFIRDFTTKNEFLGYLRRKKNLDGCDVIHLSGHGDSYTNTFDLPQGRVLPDEFPKGCFEGKIVTLSACALARKQFMDPFIAVTKADYVIGPMYDVEFADAAIWYLNYYYLILHHNFTPVGALDRTNRMLCGSSQRGRVKGGWVQWVQD